MTKLLALIDLFRKGSSVADPELWKTRQLAATVFVPMLGALASVARAFGMEIPIDDTQLAVVSGGIVVLINLVFTITTSSTVGLPTKPSNGGNGPGTDAT